MIFEKSNAQIFQGKVALICEDDKSLRKLLCSYLERFKVECIVTQTAAEAIEAFKKNNQIIDVVLLDIQLPDDDGYSVLKKMRAIDKRNIPIIAQTAFAMANDAKRIYDSGFDQYLPKPYLMNDIANALEKVFSKG